MDKIFILPILIVSTLGILSVQLSYGANQGSHLYPIKSSNDILTISVDNSTYTLGQTVLIDGKINVNYTQGIPVHITEIAPDQSKVGNFTVLVDSFGAFNGTLTIPVDGPYGKYLIKAYYEGDSRQQVVSLEISIVNPLGDVYVNIPLGSSTQGSKINFDPPTIKIAQGAKIIWTNKDNTIHTVVSGKVDDNSTLSPDRLFYSGFIRPQENYQILLEPGNYQYFCKLHPWLVGFISVSPSPSNNNNQTPESREITLPFPVSDSMLMSIWKERSDLQKAYPEVAKDNLTNIKKWATASGWTEDKRLSVLIPPGKVPSYAHTSSVSPFPIPIDILLSVYKDRKDLQSAFPEAAQGNLDNLKKWATNIGWNEDKRLAVLIPAGKIPAYTQPQSPKNVTLFDWNNNFTSIIATLTIVIIIVICGVFVYTSYSHKKIHA